jgi:hypothetical protein
MDEKLKIKIKIKMLASSDWCQTCTWVQKIRKN